MDCVRVLDKVGTVLHVLKSSNSTVSVGRDKKKCGVALPVNAQGVSRVHGSLAWNGEDTVVYTDASTYGTIVDGQLIKGGSEMVKHGSHILVGDIELKIEFSQISPTSSENAVFFEKKDSNIKKRCLINDSLISKPKRSKIDIRTSSSQQRQPQISIFLRDKLQLVEDDDCVVLAEDTPQIQNVPKAGCTQNFVSFVSDSAAGTCSNISASSNANVGSSTSSRSQPFSSAPVQRRKKQCIFDVNRRPVQYQPSPLVLVEDTQLERSRRDTRVFKNETKKDVSTVCIAETYHQIAQNPQPRNVETTVSAVASLDTRLQASDMRQVSPLISKLTPTRGVCRNLNESVPIKKARVDANPSKLETPSGETDKGMETGNVDHPNMYDILKLVSSGKRYDNVGPVENADDEKGLEIERVVATLQAEEGINLQQPSPFFSSYSLNDLVCYADIERPPKQTEVSALDQTEAVHKRVNFKRFKKASQGRFNNSLSFTVSSCIIGGNSDLVDFRQLS